MVPAVASKVYVDGADSRLEEVPKKIGLIAGEGEFPITLAQAAKGEGVEVITFGIHGYAHERIREFSDRLHMLKLTELSRLIDLSREEGVRHIVMAGRVPHGLLLLRQISLDPKLLRLIAQLPNKKADSVLKIAVEELEREGFTVLNSTLFLRSLMPEPGILTPRVLPDEEIIRDVDFGYPLAKQLGALDIGQTVAVKNQVVVAVEGLEGTDKLIERSYHLAGEGVVFVKVAKPRQDMRFDVPVVGLTTFKHLVKARAAALCVTANRSLFFDRAESIALAERHGICIMARPDTDTIRSVTPVPNA